MTQDSKKLSEKIKETFNKMNLDYELQRYEQHAHEILREEGFPTDYQAMIEHMDRAEAVPQRVRAAQSILLRIAAVRDLIGKGDAEWAAWNAIMLTRAGIRADLPEYDKALIKENNRQIAKKKGAKVR